MKYFLKENGAGTKLDLNSRVLLLEKTNVICLEKIVDIFEFASRTYKKDPYKTETLEQSVARLFVKNAKMEYSHAKGVAKRMTDLADQYTDDWDRLMAGYGFDDLPKPLILQVMSSCPDLVDYANYLNQVEYYATRKNSDRTYSKQ